MSEFARSPWTWEFDGHGGICLWDDAGRQVGFVSLPPVELMKRIAAVCEQARAAIAAAKGGSRE